MSLFSLSHFFTGLFWAMAMWTVDKGWIAFIRQFLGSFNWMIAFGGSQISSPNHCNLYHNWHTIGGMSWRSAALDHWFKSVLRFSFKNAFPVRTIRKQINSKSELFWREKKFVFFSLHQQMLSVFTVMTPLSSAKQRVRKCCQQRNRHAKTSERSLNEYCGECVCLLHICSFHFISISFFVVVVVWLYVSIFLFVVFSCAYKHPESFFSFNLLLLLLAAKLYSCCTIVFVSY